MMKVAWYQYDIVWENPESNFNKIETALAENPVDCELIIFPEMFDTGFNMKPDQLTDRSQEAVLEFAKYLSIKNSFAVIFTTIWKAERGEYRNRLFYVDGEDIQHYDKIHLFTPSGENGCYLPGTKRTVITTKNGVKILPLICYDLRFPEIARNTENIDLLIYSASWPTARIVHWEALLQARAIENQCYTIGVNRLGKDGNEYHYNGHSGLYNYDGSDAGISSRSGDIEGITSVELDLDAQREYRKKLPFLFDMR